MTSPGSVICLMLRKLLALLLIDRALGVPAAPGLARFWHCHTSEDRKQFPEATVYGASRVGVHE